MGSKRIKGRAVRWRWSSQSWNWTKWHWLPNPKLAMYTACGNSPRVVKGDIEIFSDPDSWVDCANCRRRMENG
jgi:hypothetical protein